MDMLSVLQKKMLRSIKHNKRLEITLNILIKKLIITDSNIKYMVLCHNIFLKMMQVLIYDGFSKIYVKG